MTERGPPPGSRPPPSGPTASAAKRSSGGARCAAVCSIVAYATTCRSASASARSMTAFCRSVLVPRNLLRRVSCRRFVLESPHVVEPNSIPSIVVALNVEPHQRGSTPSCCQTESRPDDVVATVVCTSQTRERAIADFVDHDSTLDYADWRLGGALDDHQRELRSVRRPHVPPGRRVSAS